MRIFPRLLRLIGPPCESRAMVPSSRRGAAGGAAGAVGAGVGGGGNGAGTGTRRRAAGGEHLRGGGAAGEPWQKLAGGDVRAVVRPLPALRARLQPGALPASPRDASRATRVRHECDTS
eukprot:1190326-Prorocentrum_minimum.AAC.1